MVWMTRNNSGEDCPRENFTCFKRFHVGEVDTRWSYIIFHLTNLMGKMWWSCFTIVIIELIIVTSKKSTTLKFMKQFYIDIRHLDVCGWSLQSIDEGQCSVITLQLRPKGRKHKLHQFWRCNRWRAFAEMACMFWYIPATLLKFSP